MTKIKRNPFARRQKKESVEKKLAGVMIILTLCLCLALIIINIAGLFINSTRLLNEDSATTVNTAAVYAERVLNQVLVSAKALSSSEILQNTSVPINTRIREMRNIARKNKYAEVGFVQTDGTGYSNKGAIDLAGTPIATVVKEKQPFVLPPLYLDSQHRICIVSGAPLYDTNGTGVLGMVYVAQEIERFNEQISSIKFGENGYAFMLSPTGSILFHPNKDTYTKQQNPIELAKTDKAFTSQANAYKKISEMQQGYITYNQDGENMYCVFKNMENYGNCILVLCTKTSDFLSNMWISGYICIGVALIFLAAALIIMRLVIRKMIRPVAQIQARFDALSAGDIRTSAKTIENKDELGEVSQSLHNTIHSLRRYIDSLSGILGHVAMGDLTIKNDIEFKGDFSALGQSIDLIIFEFNKSLCEIDGIIDNVATDAQACARRAELLSQGASSQASAVGELSSSVSFITNSIQVAEKHTQDAGYAAQLTGEELQKSNSQMQQMIAAMDDIGDKAREIGNIIKTIEGIAFQTNLLALNAAIEAAHAGKQGRGFAVVANEVRALAGKSALAAQSTTLLITQSVQSIQTGVELAKQTAVSITDVVSEAGGIVSAISDLALAAKEQTKSVNNIVKELGSIQKVVSSNSETAANSASTSENMMQQADNLKALIGQFKLDPNAAVANTVALPSDESEAMV